MLVNHSCEYLIKIFIIADFRCQLDWIKGYSDNWQNIVWVLSSRTWLEELVFELVDPIFKIKAFALSHCGHHHPIGRGTTQNTGAGT